MLPGPSIQVCQGDRIKVSIQNEMKTSTSIHWHGMLQRGTPHMDGIAQITQCPIGPKSSFLYE